MKLSEQLRQDHDCGDYGKALEGYSERAKELEDALRWYADEIEALAKNLEEKKDEAVLAFITVLSLDAGRRAKKVCAV